MYGVCFIGLMPPVTPWRTEPWCGLLLLLQAEPARRRLDQAIQHAMRTTYARTPNVFPWFRRTSQIGASAPHRSTAADVLVAYRCGTTMGGTAAFRCFSSTDAAVAAGVPHSRASRKPRRFGPCHAAMNATAALQKHQPRLLCSSSAFGTPSRLLSARVRPASPSGPLPRRAVEHRCRAALRTTLLGQASRSAAAMSSATSRRARPPARQPPG